MSSIDKPTPLPRDIRAGLDEFTRRPGRQGEFLQAMRRGLRSHHRPGLAQLAARSDQDWTNGLLSAWGEVLDVLGFYNERLSHEGYLRTATEPFSVEALAALVGYRLSPATAAEVWLAYQADPKAFADRTAMTGAGNGSGAASVVIEFAPGLAVKSVPADGEETQHFETLERLRLKPAWNEIRPLRHVPQSLRADADGFWIKPGAGPLTRPLTPGARLMFLLNDKPVAHLVPGGRGEQDGATVLRSVYHLKQADAAEGAGGAQPLHYVGLSPQQHPTAMGQLTERQLHVPEPAADANLRRTSVARFLTDLGRWQWSRAQVLEGAAEVGLDAATLDLTLASRALGVPSGGESGGVANSVQPVVLTQTARLFGHNAVTMRADLLAAMADAADTSGEGDAAAARSITVPGRVGEVVYQDGMLTTVANTSFSRTVESIHLYLDRVYDALTPGMIIVAQGRQAGQLVEGWTTIEAVETLSVEGFGQSAEVTRLEVAVQWYSPAAAEAGSAGGSTRNMSIRALDLRSVVLLTLPVALDLPDIPVTGDVQGDSLLMDRADMDLARGQSVIISGDRSDLLGVPLVQHVTLRQVAVNGDYGVLRFDPPLRAPLRRASVRICANVVRASHGLEVRETLGSGDATKPFQSFSLKQGPLTYVSAQSVSGMEPALEVYVDGVRWQRVETFDTQKGSGAGPDARAYQVMTFVDGQTRIRFGNGVMGPLLPTGQNNVTAVYRTGAGSQGRVRAGQLTLPVAKPRAIAAVRNPLPASGGSDGEQLETARMNAPRPMRAMGRVVSLSDYADFARAFAGIAKAQASWALAAEGKAVVLSVAGDDPAPLPRESGVMDNLRRALSAVAPDGMAAVVLPARVVPVSVVMNVHIDPHFAHDTVLRQVEERLRQEFSYAKRVIGEPMRSSGLIAVAQSVAGVIAVDLDAMHRAGAAAVRNTVVLAEQPRRGAFAAAMTALQGAELLVLSDDPLELGVF